MITATLYFGNGVDDGSLVESLKGLPESMRPVYFAEDEGKIIKVNVLTDDARFEKFRKRNPSGYFLYTEDKTCFDISTSRIGYSRVTLDLAEGLPTGLVTVFFKGLLNRKPVFGFAYDYKEPVPDAKGSYVISNEEARNEYDHRNRYYITIGKNHIESWIGRDLNKYISGIYWQTLLSEALLNKHHVELAALEAEAISSETLGDGSFHLLKFYESPDDWKQNAERLDNLCQRTDGIFSKKSVELAVAGVETFQEYDDIISEWR
jgi:hypothetical protein